jgi:hypothetical protein
VLQQQRIQRFQNICRDHSGPHGNAQGRAGVFIQNSEHLVGAPVAQLVVEEVDAPDAIAVCWTHSDHGAVLVIEPLASPVTVRELQTSFAPNALNLLVIDVPAFNARQPGDLAGAVTAILFG